MCKLTRNIIFSWLQALSLAFCLRLLSSTSVFQKSTFVIQSHMSLYVLLPIFYFDCELGEKVVNSFILKKKMLYIDWMYFVLLLSVILVWSKHSYPISLFHNSQLFPGSTAQQACSGPIMSLNIVYNDNQSFDIDRLLLCSLLCVQKYFLLLLFVIYCTLCYNVYTITWEMWKYIEIEIEFRNYRCV